MTTETAVSVVLAPGDHLGEAMVSLASLRSQYRGEIELILIESDPGSRGEDIESYVTGATILRFGTVLSDAAAREAGVICATAEAVLFLASDRASKTTGCTLTVDGGVKDAFPR